MRVAGENPALVSTPLRQVGRIGIMAERDGGFVQSGGWQHFLRMELFGPQIIQTDKLESASFRCCIAEDLHASGFGHRGESIGDITLSPGDSIIVIPEHTKRAKSASGKVSKNLLNMRKEILFMTREIASVNNKVRSKASDFPKNFDQKRIAYPWADVYIGQLHQSLADERRWKMFDRKGLFSEFNQVRFPTPSVCNNADDGGGSCDGGSPEELAACHAIETRGSLQMFKELREIQARRVRSPAMPTEARKWFTAKGSMLQRAASCMTFSVFATCESRAVNGYGSGLSQYS